MGTTVLIAKIFGPVFIVVATGIMLNLKFYIKVMEDFTKNAALLYLGGISALVIGIIVLISRGAWTAGWPLVITVFFGLGGVIKGAGILLFPEPVSRLTRFYTGHKNFLLIYGVLVFASGAALTIYGYFA